MNDYNLTNLLQELYLLEEKIIRLKEKYNSRDYAIFLTYYQTSLLWLKECINNRFIEEQ